MTDHTEPEPVRRDQLPPVPPPEWQFYRWADDNLSEGDRPRVNGHPVPVVRRLVTYGDWEPVVPGRWADEPAAPADEDRRQRYARAIWESTSLQQPWDEVPHIWRADTEEEAAAVMAVADAEQATLRQQLADAQARAAQADELLSIAHQCSNESEAARQAAEERAQKAERAANLLADAHRRAERAEAALDRVRALADRWALPGHISMPQAAAEIREALGTDRSQP